MVRGGDGQLGEKKELGEKNEKGKRKKEENYIKRGEQGLQNASFWAINSKKIRPACQKLICRGKK